MQLLTVNTLTMQCKKCSVRAYCDLLGSGHSATVTTSVNKRPFQEMNIVCLKIYIWNDVFSLHFYHSHKCKRNMNCIQSLWANYFITVQK